MKQTQEKSCSNFKEIRFFVDKEGSGLGVIYVSTGAGEFLSNLDLNTGINWNFSKKNLHKPLVRFKGMVFLNYSLLGDYESGREVDRDDLDSQLNRIKSKIIRLYSHRLLGKTSKDVTIDPTFIDDLQGKYAEIAKDMTLRNGATYKHVRMPDNEYIKGRLEYIGGIHDAKLNIYRVIGFMSNYYDFSQYEIVDLPRQLDQ